MSQSLVQPQNPTEIKLLSQIPKTSQVSGTFPGQPQNNEKKVSGNVPGEPQNSATKIAEQLNKGTGGPFDHIDVHWAYPDLPFGLMLAKKWGIPCTVTLRGMETFYLTDKDKRKDIIHNAMTQVDGIISLSDEMLNHAYQNGDRSTPGTVIRNGVDTSRFTHTSREKARLSLGLDTNAIILLGVGALIERKGFHHILQDLP